MSTSFESYTGYAEADEDTILDRFDDESYDESFDESFDESAFDERFDDDSAEFIGKFGSRAIGSAIGALNRIRPTIRGRGRLNIPLPNLPSGLTSGISAVSNLFGRITSPSGKHLDFKLPQTTATKNDIGVLKKAVDANTKAIQVNSAAIKKEAEAIVSVRNDLKEIDAKHISATKKQNDIMDAINVRVTKLRKDLDRTRQDAQTQQMFSLLMQPKLTNIEFTNAPAQGSNEVKSSKFDDSNLFLMLALSGGLGSGSGSENNLLPLVLLMGQPKK